MTTHYMADDLLALCRSTTGGVLHVTPVEDDVDCPSCVHYLKIVQNKWEEYKALPVNFGPDDYATRIAEEDAFKAGCRAMITEMVPF